LPDSISASHNQRIVENSFFLNLKGGL